VVVGVVVASSQIGDQRWTKWWSDWGSEVNGVLVEVAVGSRQS
jgi:hypothetical protein